MINEATVGHRQRLRERFITGNPISFTDESLLELLLTFAIPQKDLQPLAKELLCRFGSLSAVLDASATVLTQVDGVKSASTVLLKLVDTIRKARGTAIPSPAKIADVPKPKQQPLFEPAPSTQQPAPHPAKKPIRRKRTGLFGKSAIRDAISLLPKMPLTDSLDEVSIFLKANLPYNSAQTRERNSNYFRSQMFPQGDVDLALTQFARSFPVGQDLKDVCLYRFCRAESLVDDFVEQLLSSKGISGTIGRDFVLQYLRKRFPGAAAAEDCATAIVGGFEAAGVFKRKSKQITYSPRNISLPAFAFILHSEFPEPGMYDIGRMEKCRHIRSLLWKAEQFMPSLFELRNRGLISNVSEIDNVRQFTTKWTLLQVVERLAGGGKSL
jgi:hypothetical protein